MDFDEKRLELDRLTIVKENIKKAKISRNRMMACTIIWMGNASFNTYNMVLNHAPQQGLVVGINVLCILAFGIQWYKQQKELNESREEANSIQKKLTNY